MDFRDFVDFFERVSWGCEAKTISSRSFDMDMSFDCGQSLSVRCEKYPAMMSIRVKAIPLHRNRHKETTFIFLCRAFLRLFCEGLTCFKNHVFANFSKNMFFFKNKFLKTRDVPHKIFYCITIFVIYFHHTYNYFNFLEFYWFNYFLVFASQFIYFFLEVFTSKMWSMAS